MIKALLSLDERGVPRDTVRAHLAAKRTPGRNASDAEWNEWVEAVALWAEEPSVAPQAGLSAGCLIPKLTHGGCFIPETALRGITLR
jgi:hypothetical protein